MAGLSIQTIGVVFQIEGKTYHRQICEKSIVHTSRLAFRTIHRMRVANNKHHYNS